MNKFRLSLDIIISQISCQVKPGQCLLLSFSLMIYKEIDRYYEKNSPLIMANYKKKLKQLKLIIFKRSDLYPFLLQYKISNYASNFNKIFIFTCFFGDEHYIKNCNIGF